MMRLGRAAFSVPETKTGPDGAFTLRRLGPAAGLTVEASKSGYAATRKAGIRVKTGEAVRGVSLLLRLGLVARGTVVDSEGKPVSGAEVRATKAERGGRRNVAFVRIGGGAADRPDATSGPDGAFELRGLEAARYQVSASKEGFVQKAPTTLDASEEGENRVAPIVLETGVAVAGVVQNGRGEPVPGAQILVAGEGGRPLDGSTDPAGKFRIPGLVAGRAVILFVSADGYAARQSNATPPAENVAITLDTSGVVRGRVEDAATNAPVADFSISRSEPAGQAGGMVVRLAGGNEQRSFHSEDGSFELPDVPPGRWTIRAEAPGYRIAEVSGVDVAAGGTREGVVLSLKRGGSIAGRVVDAAGGAPLPNASVTWRASGSGRGRRAPARAPAPAGHRDGRRRPLLLRRPSRGEDPSRGVAPRLHGRDARSRSGPAAERRDRARFGRLDLRRRRRIGRPVAGGRRARRPRHAGRGRRAFRRRRVGHDGRRGNVSLRSPAGGPIRARRSGEHRQLTAAGGRPDGRPARGRHRPPDRERSAAARNGHGPSREPARRRARAGLFRELLRLDDDRRERPVHAPRRARGRRAPERLDVAHAGAHGADDRRGS